MSRLRPRRGSCCGASVHRASDLLTGSAHLPLSAHAQTVHPVRGRVSSVAGGDGRAFTGRLGRPLVRGGGRGLRGGRGGCGRSRCTEGRSCLRWFATDERRHRRSEEHTSELQSLILTSYAAFCLKKKQTNITLTI